MNNYLLGFELLIIGMGTVFLSLYLLSVFLYFSGKFFGPQNKVEEKKKEKAVVSEVFKDKKGVKEMKQNQLGISPRKIAAISAAVYECLNDEKNYKIISIQKNNQNWKR